MERYIGLDVSLKSTAICIVDAKGKIVREGVVTTDPRRSQRSLPCMRLSPFGSGWRAGRRQPGSGRN